MATFKLLTLLVVAPWLFVGVVSYLNGKLYERARYQRSRALMHQELAQILHPEHR